MYVYGACLFFMSVVVTVAVCWNVCCVLLNNTEPCGTPENHINKTITYNILFPVCCLPTPHDPC